MSETALRRPAPLLALVVPCYNEQEMLPRTMQALGALLESLKAAGQIAQASFALYVDDGSSDGTWDLLLRRHAADPSCRALKFSANAGHQNALVAGLLEALELGADCAISLDADLQDDIAVVPEMLERYRDGDDMVFGVRSSRATDTPFKRISARAFYGLMRRLGAPLIPDHADYRLLSRQVLQALAGFGEKSLFLRGLFPAMGFRQSRVSYARQSRQAGQSKYPLARMLSFAWRGVTSCSAAPLRLAGFMSLCCMGGALGTCAFALWRHAHGETIAGWTSLMIVVLLLGAVQLLCLALMGEYIARIFTEVRARPRYVIEKKI